MSNLVIYFHPSQYGNEALGSYTIVWSKSVDDLNVLFANETLVNNLKASKLRLVMNGYYSTIKNDIRQLYYAITEFKVKGRYTRKIITSKFDNLLYNYHILDAIAMGILQHVIQGKCHSNAIAIRIVIQQEQT